MCVLCSHIIISVTTTYIIMNIIHLSRGGGHCATITSSSLLDIYTVYRVGIMRVVYYVLYIFEFYGFHFFSLLTIVSPSTHADAPASHIYIYIYIYITCMASYCAFDSTCIVLYIIIRVLVDSQDTPRTIGDTGAATNII